MGYFQQFHPINVNYPYIIANITKYCFRWSYATIDEDIGFAVYHDWRQTSKSIEKMLPVYPNIRLECSVVPVTGSLVCDNPGRCE